MRIHVTSVQIDDTRANLIRIAEKHA